MTTDPGIDWADEGRDEDDSDDRGFDEQDVD
jgi:hypothetical protein